MSTAFYELGKFDGVVIDEIVLEEVAYHRNGISGEGFHVVTFRWAEEGDEPRPMVAVVFKELGQCAVLDREQTRQGNITFAHGNSWRGDRFEDAMREAIRLYDERVGSFDFSPVREDG